MSNLDLIGSRVFFVLFFLGVYLHFILGFDIFMNDLNKYVSI